MLTSGISHSLNGSSRTLNPNPLFTVLLFLYSLLWGVLVSKNLTLLSMSAY